MLNAFALPVQLLLVTLAGWLNRQQSAAIDYLRTENAILRELAGPRRRLDASQRRRLAVAGKALVATARASAMRAFATPSATSVMRSRGPR